MNINFNNTINFTRVLEITIDYEPYASKFDVKSKKGNPVTHAAEMVNQKRPRMYSRETFEKISNFLREQIGDCPEDKDSKNIITRIIQGRFYIFTGSESDRARLIIEEAKEATKNKNSALLRAKNLQRDKRLLNLVEDGLNGRPYVKINVVSEKDKIDSVEYITLARENGSMKLKASSLSVEC